MSDYFVQIYDLLKEGKKLVIARIVKQKGSAPRTAGTKCIIFEDGKILGSIGGGVLEYRVMEEARKVFQNNKTELYHYQFLGSDTDNIEMVCGGTADIYLEPMFPDNENIMQILSRINDLISAGGQGILLTRVSAGIPGMSDFRMLLEEGSASSGNIAGTDIDQDEISSINKNGLHDLKDPKGPVFAEIIQPREELLLFGGGHIAAYVAPIAKSIGFYVVVVDDREKFANKSRFPDADEVKTIPFSDLNENINITKKSYVVIMTRGHSHDKVVLGQVINSDAAYIGMIASRRKRDVVYNLLIEEGCSPDKLKRVYSPIGLDIKAETPEEIAISIAAELIQERAKDRSTNK